MGIFNKFGGEFCEIVWGIGNVPPLFRTTELTDPSCIVHVAHTYRSLSETLGLNVKMFEGKNPATIPGVIVIWPPSTMG